MSASAKFIGLLSALSFSLLAADQAPRWKAEIKSENGIKVIINPSTPRFGELRFDLTEDLVLGSEKSTNQSFVRVWDVKADDQGNIFVLDSGNQRILKFDSAGKWLQTIGRHGQGPGEFQMPVGLCLDGRQSLYVLEMRKIHVFAPGGGFVRTMITPSFLMDFVPDGEGNAIIAGYIQTEKAKDFGVLLIDANGEILRKIAAFPGLPIGRGGATIDHDYSPDLRICAAEKAGFIYGYSPQYKLYCADWTGEKTLIIEKKEPSRTVSRKEKGKIIDGHVEITTKGGFGWSRDEVERAANIPQDRPFFRGIMTDDEGRIYVKKVKSVLEESEEIEYDIFSRDGYYLYSARLPFAPTDIRAGCLYSISESEETGEVRVIRHKIKNWGRIGLPDPQRPLLLD